MITFNADWFAGFDREVPARGPELDVSNANSIALFQILGFVDDSAEFDLIMGCPIVCAEEIGGGSCPAEDFLGRVLMATGLLQLSTDDAHGKPAVDISVQGGPRVIDCGRRPGYLAEKLAELATIAQFGVTHGTVVSWA